MATRECWRCVVFVLSGLCLRIVARVLGFSHRATTDIVWENYLIPKGATVIGNHWYVQRDCLSGG